MAVTALGGATPAHAGFSAAPSIVELEVRPGGTVVGTVDVRLEDERRARLTVAPEDVVQLADGGFAFRRPTGAAQAASSWIAVSPRSFAGAPDRVQPVEYRLSVPRDARPGDHTVSLTVKRRVTPGRPAQATAVQALSVRVSIRVAGRARERVSLDLDAPGMAGRGPLTATLRVRNTGNTTLDFDRRNRGALLFVDGGDVQARLALRGVLLPRQMRVLTLPWQDPPPAARVHARGELATSRGVLTRSADIWMVPWRQAAAIALLAGGLAVLLGGRRSRKRHAPAARRLIPARGSARWSRAPRSRPWPPRSARRCSTSPRSCSSS